MSPIAAPTVSSSEFPRQETTEPFAPTNPLADPVFNNGCVGFVDTGVLCDNLDFDEQFFCTADSFDLESFGFLPFEASASDVVSTKTEEDFFPDIGDVHPLDLPSFPHQPAGSPGSPGLSRKRRPKVPVPPEIKSSEKYQERRRKNNLAAARNRALKRLQAKVEVDRLPGLTRDNQELRTQCQLLRTELVRLCMQVQVRLGSSVNVL